MDTDGELTGVTTMINAAVSNIEEKRQRLFKCEGVVNSERFYEYQPLDHSNNQWMTSDINNAFVSHCSRKK